MKLNFVSPHKSIRFFPSIELPEFVVLTGVNGAGKSHFLESLAQGFIRIDGVDHNPHLQKIRRFDWTNLVPNDSPPFAAFESKQERGAMWVQLAETTRLQRQHLFQSVAQFPGLAKLDCRQLVGLKHEDLVGMGNSDDIATQIIQIIDSTAQGLSRNVATQFNQHDPQNRPRLLSMLEASSNLPLIAYEESDFYDNFPTSWQPVDMFQQSFSRLFAEYQESRRRNLFQTWQNAEYGKNYPVLKEQEFIKKYGPPPWEFVNSILKSANLDFRINAPDESEDRPYEPILIDELRGLKVKFSDLSSGERVLMSFALCLYYANDKRQLVQYPEVLLFDEIDAPLHPSMTKSLLRTIKNVLVDQQNIKVIMTTHSPSTVALAEDDWLYAMRKDGEERMTKIPKDGALSILMAGVPSLSISYDNRRQIFVESHHDVSYYETLYEKLKQSLIPEISLNFIASGAGNVGGCAHVMDVVQKLSAAGNKTIYGIVDWDTKNISGDRVKVLGEGKRYSIENYLLDPILIAALLVREKIWGRKDVDFEEDNTYIDFLKLDNARLQKIANLVLEKISLRVEKKDNTEKILCNYVGGNSVELPKWFLQIQGHQLEKITKETFPELNSFHGENGLKTAMLKRVIDDMPSFIPACILDIFRNIQNGGLHQNG